MEKLNETLSNAIFEHTGLMVKPEDIYDNGKEEWHYYICKRSLLPGYPLVLVHYRGSLFAVIPAEDYKMLEEAETPQRIYDYVKSAKWSFGAYKGGGHVIGGIYYKPITAKEDILQYMATLRCRIFFWSSGYKPLRSNCNHCSLEKCSFSCLEEKKQGSIEDEENDLRRVFIKLLVQRVEETFGIRAKIISSHERDGKVHLSKSTDSQGEIIMMSMDYGVLSHLLSEPGIFSEKNINQLVQDCTLELHLTNPRSFVTETQILPQGIDPIAFSKYFWEVKDQPHDSDDPQDMPTMLKASWWRRIFK